MVGLLGGVVDETHVVGREEVSWWYKLGGLCRTTSDHTGRGDWNIGFLLSLKKVVCKYYDPHPHGGGILGDDNTRVLVPLQVAVPLLADLQPLKADGQMINSHAQRGCIQLTSLAQYPSPPGRLNLRPSRTPARKSGPGVSTPVVGLVLDSS